MVNGKAQCQKRRSPQLVQASQEAAQRLSRESATRRVAMLLKFLSEHQGEPRFRVSDKDPSELVRDGYIPGELSIAEAADRLEMSIGDASIAFNWLVARGLVEVASTSLLRTTLRWVHGQALPEDFR